MDQRPQLKPWIEAIHPYVPGRSTGAGGRELVKLSANENPLGCSDAAREALARPHDPARYPDPDATALREAIGAAHGIDPARIVCGTGSGELLGCAVQAYAGRGDAVLFSRFSFSLYPLLAAKVGAEAIMAEPVDYGADVDAMIAALDERVKVVLLDNPNNPVGSSLSDAEVERLHAALPPTTLLVLDQAYAEYGDPQAARAGLELAAQAANVLVTRTFSKVHGLAAERIGWATGAPHLVDALNRLRGPFNVSTGGQAAACAAIGDTDFVEHSRTHNATERERFTGAMRALGNHGLRSIPSAANFVLVLFEGDLTAEMARDGLVEAGYAVRHLPGQGLPHALRITVGTAKDMDTIATTIRERAERA
ncbi:aminotransferase class I/II-fold pyridoxal phosphate-dependent enzyme [Erythrobacter sp. LQ02-29]|uniref:pyridoxal phosphate-dependent aminotransferase n=1 Tax=Erythrobacter sp. LQ02-29 TaxID=2920384 RepID=UPI001F4D9192|nr:histidinol-phosphate transaminase [Erythrobacter sp. LQ02-29]MCP9221291.1 aminotransferase class I/II-fold pyridoxal phosphate-dependent enzyme [Erythrobacter sp. LQ02-29]